MSPSVRSAIANWLAFNEDRKVEKVDFEAIQSAEADARYQLTQLGKVPETESFLSQFRRQAALAILRHKVKHGNVMASDFRVCLNSLTRNGALSDELEAFKVIQGGSTAKGINHGYIDNLLVTYMAETKGDWNYVDTILSRQSRDFFDYLLEVQMLDNIYSHHNEGKSYAGDLIIYNDKYPTHTITAGSEVDKDLLSRQEELVVDFPAIYTFNFLAEVKEVPIPLKVVVDKKYVEDYRNKYRRSKGAIIEIDQAIVDAMTKLNLTPISKGVSFKTNINRLIGFLRRLSRRNRPARQ